MKTMRTFGWLFLVAVLATCGAGCKGGIVGGVDTASEGSREHPWQIGATNAADMVAWMVGDAVTIDGRGTMKDFESIGPWGTGVYSVSVGPQVESIGERAFTNCSTLTIAFYKGNPPAVGVGNGPLTNAASLVRWDAYEKFASNLSWKNKAAPFRPYYYETNVVTHAPFLHEVKFKEGYASRVDGCLTSTPSTYPAFSCSGLRKGGFVGRTFDYFLDEVPTFIVRMPSKTEDGVKTRLASVGVAQQWGMREQDVLDGKYTASYDDLPNMTLDGVNECGVVITDNVVPMHDCGEMTGTNPGAPSLHILYVVRYVLDHATNAAHGVELIRGRNLVGDVCGQCLLHYLISDKKESYVVEIINNKVVARRFNAMTNFNVNWDNEGKCAIEGDDEKHAFGHYPDPGDSGVTYGDITSCYTEHASGVERFIRLQNLNATAIGSAEAMVGVMKHVAFANLCDTSDLAHYWYTDSVNADHTFYGLYKQLKSADKGEREAATKHAKWFADDYREHVVECKEAIRKNPRNPQDWQTVHLTAYDIDKKTFLIGVQENFGELFIGGLDMETRRFRANKISSK